MLLIIFVDQVKGTGRLSSKAVERYLGSGFRRDQLEKAAHDLENLGLGKVDISSPEAEIEFELLREEVRIEKQN